MRRSGVARHTEPIFQNPRQHAGNDRADADEKALHREPGCALFFGQIIRKYRGTRLGRQELEAELLEDVPGALWNRGMLEGLRAHSAPPLIRVVVAMGLAGGPRAVEERGRRMAGVSAR